MSFFDLYRPIAEAVQRKREAEENESKSIWKEPNSEYQQIIFNYVMESMAQEPPVSIVILTDGYAKFPKERIANGIPVLWIIDNEKVTPLWGKIARISVDN